MAHDVGNCSICGRIYNKYDVDMAITLENYISGTSHNQRLCIDCFESVRKYLIRLKEETNAAKKQRGY